jgi:hypothetical protein
MTIIVKRMASEWTTYRTRFLINAKQLDASLTFVDAIGREHSGQKGDYLVQSSDGSRRIAPREIFEDIYVPMAQPGALWPVSARISDSSPADVLQVDRQARSQGMHSQHTVRRRSSGGAPVSLDPVFARDGRAEPTNDESRHKSSSIAKN